MSLKEALLSERIVFCESDITDEQSTVLISNLLALDSINNSDPIKLIVNSPGGDMTAGAAIVDTILGCTSPIYTIALGKVHSYAVRVVAAGAPGHRYSFPNTVFMFHRPSLSSDDGIVNISNFLANAKAQERRADALLVQQTGDKWKNRRRQTSQDFYFFPEKALEFGIIDQILTKGIWGL